jgi:hypothetical protein
LHPGQAAPRASSNRSYRPSTICPSPYVCLKEDIKGNDRGKAKMFRAIDYLIKRLFTWREKPGINQNKKKNQIIEKAR